MENNWEKRLKEALAEVPDGVKITDITVLVSETLRSRPCKCLNCNTHLAIRQNRPNQTKIIRQDPSLELLKAHLSNKTINKYAKGRDTAESILCENCWHEFGVEGIYNALDEIARSKEEARNARRVSNEKREYDMEREKAEAFIAGKLVVEEGFFLLVSAYNADSGLYRVTDAYAALYDKILMFSGYKTILKNPNITANEYYETNWYKTINKALQGHNVCQKCGSEHTYYNPVNLNHSNSNWFGKEIFVFMNCQTNRCKDNILKADLSKALMVPVSGGPLTKTLTGMTFLCSNCTMQ